MSAGNGVIRIGRKGLKKFAFGEDGAPFEVDVVAAFQQWIGIDEQHRQTDGERKGSILSEDYAAYHQAAVDFATGLTVKQGATVADIPDITIAEALDFIARLREQYDELVDFFRPKRPERDESPGTSGVELQFSEEPEPSPSSTN
jgi:hypothetical protein